VAGKRRRYSAKFKAKVALEAIRNEATIAELLSKHGVHQTLINGWKRQAMDGMAGVFSGKPMRLPPSGRASSRSCTRRSASSWWSGIF
jgi:transposase-like protein